MSVYKKTCESGKVYYGSTKNDIEVRLNKGHYKTTCKDFINPKTEILEYIEDDTERYERELFYIKNFECVNKKGKGFNHEEWRKNNRDKIKNNRIKSEQKNEVWVKIKCDICGRETNKKHYKRHCKSAYHQRYLIAQ